MVSGIFISGWHIVRTLVHGLTTLDRTVLGQVLVVSLALSIGLVALFPLGLTASHNPRKGYGSSLSRIVGRLGVVVTSVGVALVLGRAPTS